MTNSRWIATGGCALLCVGCAAETSTGLGFGALLSRTLLVLFAVSVLAVVSLRWLAGKGFGKAGTAGSGLDVLERIPVGPRQSVLALRAADRVLIVGLSGQRFDALGDVDLADWQRANERSGAGLPERLDQATTVSRDADDALLVAPVADDVSAPRDGAERMRKRTFSQVLAAAEGESAAQEAGS